MPRVTGAFWITGYSEQRFRLILGGGLGYRLPLAPEPLQEKGTKHDAPTGVRLFCSQHNGAGLAPSVETCATSSLVTPLLISPPGAEKPGSQSPHRRADGLAPGNIIVVVSQEGLNKSYTRPLTTSRSIPKTLLHQGGLSSRGPFQPHPFDVDSRFQTELQDHEAPLCGRPVITEFLVAPQRSSCTAQRPVLFKRRFFDACAYGSTDTGVPCPVSRTLLFCE